MEIHEVTVPKTARYCTFGNKNKANRFWFCCHGYGQLAPYFITNFDKLDPTENFVVAPEGLHRFYLRNSEGRVGASWMTKESRETDIADYLTYMDMVYRDCGMADRPEVPLIAFGFSQGVATLSRWIAHTRAPIARAVFWAGAFPPDLEPAIVKEKFSALSTHCFIGDTDEFIDQAAIERAKTHYAELGLSPQWTVFSGGHQIDKNLLVKLVE